MSPFTRRRRPVRLRARAVADARPAERPGAAAGARGAADLRREGAEDRALPIDLQRIDHDRQRRGEAWSAEALTVARNGSTNRALTDIIRRAWKQSAACGVHTGGTLAPPLRRSFMSRIRSFCTSLACSPLRQRLAVRLGRPPPRRSRRSCGSTTRASDPLCRAYHGRPGAADLQGRPSTSTSR